MSTRKLTALLCGTFLLAGAVIGAVLVWTLTGAGETGQGTGRGALDTPSQSFTLSGDLSQAISPGVFAPLDLSISNSNDEALVISDLVVTVSAVDAPNATALEPCTPEDFGVEQLDTELPLVVGAEATIALSELGVPSSDWPQVGMPLDEATNQNGCKGASITLSYTALGRVDQ